MTNNSGDEKCSQLVMIAWTLWCNRNEIYHGGEAKNGLEVARYVACYLQEYWSAIEKHDSTTSNLVQHSGNIIRDQQGRLLAALCRKIRAQLGVIEIKAKAYKAGVLLARHLGLKNGVLEGDSLIISNALNQVSQAPTSVAAIVEGIHFLSSDVGIVGYSQVQRTGNQPAHILARQAQSLVNDVIWIEEIPCYIQQAFIHDVFGS
nr:hypothetical protein CFP56_64294 [Quercus suber]